MKITPATISKLAEYLPALELFARYTPTTLDDKIVEILKTVSEDEQMIEWLAEFLNLILPGAAGPVAELPPAMIQYEQPLMEWRSYLATCPDCQ